MRTAVRYVIDGGSDAVRATRAKFDHGTSGSGRGDARSFAGDERLEMKNAEQARFDELRFGDRGSDAKQGFAGEEIRSLGQRPDITGKAESREIVKEVRMDLAKQRQRAQVGDVFPGEADVFKELESLFKAGGNEIIAAMWKLPHKQFEGGAGVEAVLDITGRHGKFIEVGEETGEKSASEHVGDEIMPAGRKEQR